MALLPSSDEVQCIPRQRLTDSSSTNGVDSISSPDDISKAKFKKSMVFTQGRNNKTYISVH